MLSCYTNYIGLTLCYGEGVYDVPPSGVYIDTLPGLQLESIDKIATEEQITFKGVWEDVQKGALGQFRQDVLFELKKCYSLNTECDLDELICNNIELTTQAYKYLLGVWLLLFRVNSNRLNRYTTVDMAQAKELKDFYQVEYEKALTQAVMLFDTTDCELCCSTNPEIVVWLP